MAPVDVGIDHPKIIMEALHWCEPNFLTENGYYLPLLKVPFPPKTFYNSYSILLHSSKIRDQIIRKCFGYSFLKTNHSLPLFSPLTDEELS